MDGTDTVGFGGLLRHYRLTRGLTQEALAEHAGLGVRSIQHLERGETHPQRATAHRLAAALGLSADQRAAFAALAHPIPRRRTVSATPTPPSSAARTPRDGAHPAPIALVLAQGEDAVCVAQSTSPRR